jgi:hypothetical protein
MDETFEIIDDRYAVDGTVDAVSVEFVITGGTGATGKDGPAGKDGAPGKDGPAGPNVVTPTTTAQFDDGIVRVSNGKFFTGVGVDPGEVTLDDTTKWGAGGAGFVFVSKGSEYVQLLESIDVLNEIGAVAEATRNKANGFAGLDDNAKLFVAQLPTHTHTVSQLSDATTVGQALAKAIDAAAGRLAIGAAATTGTLGQFAATTSDQLAAVLSDETGSGSAVFSVSPTLTGTVTVTSLTASGAITGRTGGYGTPTLISSGGGYLSLGTTQSSFVASNSVSSLIATPIHTMLQGLRLTESNDIGLFRNAEGPAVEVTNGTPTASGGALRGLRVSGIRGATGSWLALASVSGVGTNGATVWQPMSDTGVGLRIMPGTLREIMMLTQDGQEIARFDNTRNSRFFGLTTLGTFTVSTLPSASANAGAFAQVTDANSTTNGSIVAGGGSNRVPVFSNGINWIIK